MAALSPTIAYQYPIPDAQYATILYVRTMPRHVTHHPTFTYTTESTVAQVSSFVQERSTTIQIALHTVFLIASLEKSFAERRTYQPILAAIGQYAFQ